MMKHVNYYSTIILVLVAFINIQFAVAKPGVAQFVSIHVSPLESADQGDDDKEDTDGRDDQCELIFPFCEANVV